MDGRMDAINCFTLPANVVGNDALLTSTRAVTVGVPTTVTDCACCCRRHRVPSARCAVCRTH